MAKKLIMWSMMTLDGMIEGPNREIDWHEHVWGEELEAYSNDTGRAAGGLLFGWATYQLMAGYWPTAEGEIAEFMTPCRRSSSRGPSRRPTGPTRGSSETTPPTRSAG